ncbi:MAG: hypothetical protein IIC36_15735, partial [Gemmatimonadetes bacterium]|nr:hypothetical protein [Gemmatimonadota bacterium]
MRATALMMVIVMVACGSASCGGEPPITEGERFVVRDSSGVRISESRDSAWTSETAQRLSGTPALEIGTLSGPDPATTFTFVRDVVRFPDGRTAVLDFLTREIRIFGRDGQHILTFGREGDGPGEFRGPARMSVVHGDSVVVWDLDGRRISVFSDRGDFGRSFAFSSFDWNGLAAAGVAGWFLDASFVVTHTLQAGDLSRSLGIATAQWHLAGADGEHVRQLTALPAAHGRALASAGPYQVDGRTRFSPEPSSGLDSSGLWHAFPLTYELRHVTREGRLDRIVRRAWQPKTLPDEVRASYREWYEREGESPRASRARVQAELRQLTFMDTLP